MVRRISVLLLRRSTKLSKFRTPLRTLVEKHYIWRQSNSNVSTSQLFDSLCQPYKIVLSDKVGFWLNFLCHQLEKQVQNEEDTLQVINICFRDWLSRLHKGKTSVSVMRAWKRLDWVGKILWIVLTWNMISFGPFKIFTGACRCKEFPLWWTHDLKFCLQQWVLRSFCQVC